MQPGVTEDDVLDEVGLAQLHPDDSGGVSVLLGVGNVISIGPLDCLYELVAHNRLAILKLNPVLDEMLEVTRAVLAPHVQLGAAHVVVGRRRPRDPDRAACRGLPLQPLSVPRRPGALHHGELHVRRLHLGAQLHDRGRLHRPGPRLHRAAGRRWR